VTRRGAGGTSRRTSSGSRAGAGSGAGSGAGRRPSSRSTGSGRTRRRTPRTSTTLGGAFALGLVAVFTRASWPVRIGVVVVALLAVAAVLVVRLVVGARRAPSDPKDPPT